MFTQADLPITDQGRVYHLALRPEELSENIILVGDPERVPLIAEQFLETIEFDVSHRGLRSVTGTAGESGLRVSIVTSGMGTSSLEIVLQEIAALNEIDFSARVRKPAWPKLKLIRVGTSGAIHSDMELGTSIISEYAIGLDNTGLFYDTECPGEAAAEIEREVLRLLNEAAEKGQRFFGAVRPYAAAACRRICAALKQACEALKIPHSAGITASNSGFFANQGRDIARIASSIPDIDRELCKAGFKSTPLRIENMEMEASFLLHFAAGLGYEAGVICPVIANRADNTFVEAYDDVVKGAAHAALRALDLLQQS